MTTNKGFIYLIESIKIHKRYLGSINNPNNRITQHNNSYVRATKNDMLWKYLLVINAGTLSEARKIEYYIKKQNIKLSVRSVIKVLNWYYQNRAHSSVG